MVRKRFHELESERRERILEAAGSEFADRGYEAASVNRIASQAGISKGSLYYYFDDKEDVFATVMELATARLLAAVGGIDLGSLTATTFWNSFRDMMLRAVESLHVDNWYVRLSRSFHHLRRHAPTSPAVLRLADLGRGYIRDTLARGQELGVVRNDLPLDLLIEMTRAVEEAGDAWRAERWNEFSADERRAHADGQIDLIRDMLHAKNQGWEDEPT